MREEGAVRCEQRESFSCGILPEQTEVPDTSRGHVRRMRGPPLQKSPSLTFPPLILAHSARIDTRSLGAISPAPGPVAFRSLRKSKMPSPSTPS